MKNTMYLSFITALTMLISPFAVFSDKNTPPPKSDVIIETSASIVDTQQIKKDEEDIFRLYDPETKKITEIRADEYIFGVVAGEMPALFEEEALKAQAVAAYTYACYNRNVRKNETYDLSTDPNDSQCFITNEEASKRWGSKAEEYTNKIKSIINDVSGYAITYQGKEILAVYHAISAGKTRNSKDVWSKEYPYLQSVNCDFDKETENYKTEITFSVKEIKEKLKNSVNIKGKAKNYFGESTKCEAGYVNKILVCSEYIKGSDLREILNLRSNCYEVKYNENEFIFTVYGYGHGVGMSQNGANELAKKGKDFKEILKHFYTNCDVEKLR